MSDAAAPGAEQKPPRAPRGRLFRRYALGFALLIAGALLVSGAIEVYFSYQEHKQALVRLQQEKAAGAAALVSQFIDEIEAQVGWSLHSAFMPGEAGTSQRRLDFIRLLRQVPAVTELSYLDGDGREQLRVSRLSIDMEGTGADLSQEPIFTQAREHGLYLSPVYFHKESEPHLTMALAGAGRSPGVTAAEVNLKFIWDLVSQMQVGEAGRAYVVDADNRLIAHPDISLVLRKIDLSDLPHVRAARAAAMDGVSIAVGQEISRDPEGRAVLSANAFIAPLGWIVFVDLPVNEAFGPVIASLERTGAIVLLGIGLAVVIGLALGRRMTGPIRLLREGAARIGGGDLTRRIEVKTGDELEALADEFNAMAARLSESHSTLEQRVVDRTQALSEALGKLRALAEVAEVVNSSLDLETVLRTILAHACQLPDTGGGAIYVFDTDSGRFRLAAGYGMSDDLVASIRKHEVRLGMTIVGRCAAQRTAVQILDLKQEPRDPLHDVLLQSGIRALLGVPLLHQDNVIGALIVRRQSAGTFADETIDLLESFASQSALAVHNAGLFREIEQKSRQLELASQHKSQFLANMSHELRTPMNAIIGFTRLVMRRSKEVLAERQYENLEKILASSGHLLSLINSVLDLSKIEAGQMELRPVGFALEPLVDQCLRTVEPMVKTERVQLVKRIEPDIPALFNDQDKLRQILMNLLSNAAKFTQEGAITLDVWRRDGAINITVSDTGIGIPDEAHELVFEEFQQVDNSSTRQHAGTGLGLAISLRLARLMGGDITLQSTAGEGSTFNVTIPESHPRAIPADAPVEASSRKHATALSADEAPKRPGIDNGKLLLAIDDDPDVILLLQENLADAGYRVVGAANGDEGLKKACELRPSAITLDIMMPEKDGWQILNSLKSTAETSDIPVILLSVVDQKDLGYRLGASDYLLKPFERDDLLGVLARIAPRCRRLLIVDDDSQVADLVRQLLEGEMYTFDTAKDGLAGLKAIDKQRPDVILLDLLMPRMDGFGVLEALHREAGLREIPVIVLTAKMLTSDEAARLKKRTRAVIEKSALDRDALMRELRQALPIGSAAGRAEASA